MLRNGRILAIVQSLLKQDDCSVLIWALKLRQESSLKPRFLAVLTNLIQTEGFMNDPLV